MCGGFLFGRGPIYLDDAGRRAFAAGAPSYYSIIAMGA